MGHKAVESTHDNNAFGPGTANKHTVQWWFKRSCKGHKRPEDMEHGGWPWEVDNDQLRGSSKLILLQFHNKLPNNSTSQIGKVKKLDKWVSCELITNQKYHHFEVLSSLILCDKNMCDKNNEPFLNQIVTKSGFYATTSIKCWLILCNHPAQWLDQEEAPKHLPKPNLHQKKVTVTVCCPSNPPQLFESR